VKRNRYRKIPKDSDDSATTEWETITEPDTEVEKEEEEIEAVEESEEEVEIEPKTPDPYGYTELHTNIEHIEEFDDNFVSNIVVRFRFTHSIGCKFHGNISRKFAPLNVLLHLFRIELLR